MKQFVYVSLLVLTLATLVVLPCLSEDAVLVAGYIYIPSTNLVAEVYSSSVPQCDCCSALWNGGLATTKADLSSVKVAGMANVVLSGGERMVMECVAITPCVKLGGWLISWPGALRVDGDLLIYSNGLVYRFVHL